MTASEKTAFLKGLAEGLDINRDSSEGKLLLAMIDVLGELAKDIEDLEANQAMLADTVDDIADDMAYLEDMCSGFADEDDEPDDLDDACGGDCSACSGCSGDVGYEVICPECSNSVTVYDEDIAFGSMACPFCAAEIEFDLDSDDAEDEDEEEDE